MIESKTLVDCSFVVNLLGVGGVLTREKAVNFFETNFFVPPLFWYEMGSVFSKFDLKPQVEDAFVDLEITTLPRPNWKQTRVLAKKHQLSFYDATYYAALLENNIETLLTFDRDFLRIGDKRIQVLGS